MSTCSNPSVRRGQIENRVRCFSVLKFVSSGAYPPAKLHLLNLPQRTPTGLSIQIPRPLLLKSGFLICFEADFLIIKSKSLPCLEDRFVKASLYFSCVVCILISCFFPVFLPCFSPALPPHQSSSTLGQSSFFIPSRLQSCSSFFCFLFFRIFGLF